MTSHRLFISKYPDENIGLKCIPSESGLFRAIPESVSGPFRTNPKNILYLVGWKTVKNQSHLIRFNPRHQFEWNRTIPNQSELGLIQIKFSIRIDPKPEWFGLIRIYFLPFIIKQDTKSFSDWFGMTRNGS